MYQSIRESGLSFETVAAFTGGTLINAPEEPLSAFGVSTDSRTANKGDFFIALRGENFDGHRFLPAAEAAGCVFAVVDTVPDGCTLPLIVVNNTTEALGKIASEYQKLFSVVSLAVTGSVGKTTTKELLYAILETTYKTNVTKGNFNNEIGLPQTVLSLTAEHTAQLLEMGMNHKGEISVLSHIAKPDIAVITNIGTSHIEHLGSREGIRDAKMEIIDGMKTGGILVYNGDEPLLRGQDTGKIYQIPVGIWRNDVVYKAERIHMSDEYTSFDIILPSGESLRDVYIPLVGEHHVMNALLACAAAFALQISPENVREGLLRFRPAAMRQQFIEKSGYTVIADCYNASPESMNAALQVLKKTVLARETRAIAVLGDMLELGSYSEEMHLLIGERAAYAHLSHLITFGDAAKQIARGAIANGMSESSITVLESGAPIEENAAKIRALIRPNDVVLFKASRAMALERIVALLD